LSCREIAPDSEIEMRGLCAQFRSATLDALGLAAALRVTLECKARVAGWKLDFAADQLHRRLFPEIETVCFRVAEAALNIAARHAQATRVGIRLRMAGGAIELTVRDDGNGFNASVPWHHLAAVPVLGLISMEERATLAAGRLEIFASRGAGTEIRATFPAHWRA
jgi:signal transduction histidine kinase